MTIPMKIPTNGHLKGAVRFSSFFFSSQFSTIVDIEDATDEWHEDSEYDDGEVHEWR